MHFVKNWRTPREDIGIMIYKVYAWTQYQADVLYPILENTGTDLSDISGRTILATRNSLNEINAIVRLDNKYLQQQLYLMMCPLWN